MEFRVGDIVEGIDREVRHMKVVQILQSTVIVE
jgi:hypothetical protein